MSSSTRLRGKNDYPTTVRMNESYTQFDPECVIGRASIGAVVRGLNNNDFSDMNNISVVGTSFGTKRPHEAVVVDTKRVVVLKDKAGVEHKMDPKDDGTIAHMITAGMLFLRTEEIDVMG